MKSHPNSHRLQKWLETTGHAPLAREAEFLLHPDDFQKHLDEIRHQHAHHTEEEMRDRAAYRCLTQGRRPALEAKPVVHAPEHPRHLLRDGVIMALLLAILFLLLARTGHAQTPTGSATAASPAWTEGQRVPFSFDRSGRLRTIVTGGASGGTSAIDNSVFTGGSDSLTPIGGWYSTSPTAIVDGKTGIIRMDASRYMYVNCAVGCSASSAADTVGSAQTYSASGQAASVALAGQNGAVVQFTAGASPVMTLVCEVSGDGGTNYSNSCVFVDPTSGAISTSLSNPANGQYLLGWLGSESHVRVKTSAYTSGSLTATVRSTVNRPYSFVFGSDGTNMRALKTATDGTLKVDGSAVTQPVSAASLPLPAGASTAAKQPALGTAGSASADVITVQGVASMTALKVDGSGVTQPVSGTVTANAGTGTMTIAGGKTNNNAAPGATNVGVLPALANAAQASWTEGNQVLNSTDLKGNQRTRIQDAAGNDRGANVNASNQLSVSVDNTPTVTANAGTGNFTVVQPTGTSLHTVCDSGCSSSTAPADNSAFTAGTTSSTPVSGFYHATRDSLTDGRIGAIALNVNRAVLVQLEDASKNGITSTSNALDVNLKSSGATVTVSGTVTSNQGTANTAANRWPVYVTDGTNNMPTGDAAARTIHVTTDNASIPVTESGTWSNRMQDGAGNALTTNSTTYTAKFALDQNLLGTLGTAFTTAGKVDVKGVDGDLFVRNLTASNFLATVTQGTAAAGSGAWPIAQIDTSNTIVKPGDAVNNAIRVNVVAGGAAGGTSSNYAAAFPATGTAAGFKDPGGYMASASVDVNGSLIVNDDQSVKQIAKLDRDFLLNTPVVNRLNRSIGVNVLSAPILDPCQGRKSALAISQIASTQLLSASGGQQIFVCGVFVVGADAENVSLVAGTGATCGTGTIALIGGTTAATGPNMAANGGWSAGFSNSTLTGAAQNLCLLQSGTGRVAGNLSYVLSP